jgi:outer membrane protein assembly factor BamD (BamD/ComL family)
VATLDAARQMVSTNPVGALRALDEYQSQFPHGDLAPEALVLRIEALVRSDQRAAADKLARENLARNPGSPHARKIRTLLGEPAAPSR